MVDTKSTPRSTVRRGTSHKVRRTMPHRDKTKYTRKEKHEKPNTIPSPDG